jgi:DNA-binding transcriptional regulator YhcF (GntR family)
MEFRERQGIYMQIGDYICENILRKQWVQGDRIPSIREMSVSMEVNPNTVMRSYNYLQERGVIFNKRGIGYFVADNAYAKTLELKKKGFVKHELPRLFNTMDLLDLSFEDLEHIYREGR